MITYSNMGDMEWSCDGDNTDYSTTSSSPTNVRKIIQNQEQDSLSEDDDLSDELSLLDSEDERKNNVRCTPIMQVNIYFQTNIYLIKF